MSKISIEGTPVASESLASIGPEPGLPPEDVSGHLLLIFENDFGVERVIRGGPQSGVPFFWGPLVIQNDILLETSFDSRDLGDGRFISPAARGNRLVSLNGRFPEHVWSVLSQHAQNIHNRAFTYDPAPIFSHQGNSNAFIANLLHLVGIPLEPILPNPVFGTTFSYVGKNHQLNFDYSISGTSGNDILNGRGGKQVFFGGAGSDRLSGGRGDDTLNGGAGKDFLTGRRNNDSLIGGEGTDTAIYGSNYAQNNKVQYKLSRADNKKDFVVNALSTRGDRPPFDGTDTLSGVEFLQFPDALVELSEKPRYTRRSKMLDKDGKQIGFLELDVPVRMADRDADYTLTLSPNTGKQFNLAYIIDVSASMRGASLADAKATYSRFTRALIDNGIADRSQFAVIPFNTTASLQAPLNASEAIATIQALEVSSSTRFNPPLEQAVNFFHTAPPNATNLAFFLSDGGGAGASSLLQAYANVQAYGIGKARFDQLDTIDSDTATQLTDSSDLIDAFANADLAAADFADSRSDYDLTAENIAQIDILVGDRVVETIQGTQLVQRLAGLSYKGSLENLDVSIDAKNAVTARVTLADEQPQAQVVTTIASGAVSSDNPSPSVATGDDNLLILDPIAESVDGLGGDDLILGNSRFNTLAGGAGNDEIHAGDGDDTIKPGAGNDIVDGGDGIDIVTYDKLKDDAGLVHKVGDRLHLADTEVDTLTGVEFVQFADGWLNTDTLRTSDSVQIRDQLLGSMKRDQLVGTDEDEELLGLRGSDVLTGGAGADRFVYTEFRDIGDVVTDFEVG